MKNIIGYQQTPDVQNYHQSQYPSTYQPSQYPLELTFDEYEIITYDQFPTTIQWALSPLYKINERGKRLYWQIGYNPYENKLISLSRQMENAKGEKGKLKVSKVEIKKNKSGRNFQEQALLEAKSKYHKKYQENYRPEGESESIFFPPQLANDYRPPINYLTGEGSQITLRHLQRGVACQSKIDGIRARSWILTSEIPEKNQVILLSRKDNEFTSPYHIKEELKYFFSFLYQEIINKGYNPYGESMKTQWGIDGELYDHELSFEEISSRVRTKNKIHPQVIDLKYYIFDLIVPNVPYDVRKEILETSYTNYYQYRQGQTYLILLSTLIANSYEEIDTYLMHFISYNYEGLMMRKILGNNPNNDEIQETYYEPKRSNNLLKYKLTVTEEGIVLDIVPGEGKESDLAEIIIRDIRGNILKIHPSGPYEARREWLQNKYKYIGLPYTFKYQELTEDGIPRFAVGIVFRTYE